MDTPGRHLLLIISTFPFLPLNSNNYDLFVCKAVTQCLPNQFEPLKTHGGSRGSKSPAAPVCYWAVSGPALRDIFLHSPSPVVAVAFSLSSSPCFVGQLLTWLLCCADSAISAVCPKESVTPLGPPSSLERFIRVKRKNVRVWMKREGVLWFA